MSLLYKTRVAMRFPHKNYLELRSGCHTCRLSNFQIGYACGADGRAGGHAGVRACGRAGVRSRDYQNFSDV